MDRLTNHRELERWYRLRNITRAAQVLVVAVVVALVAGYGISRLLGTAQEIPGAVVTPGEGSRLENFSYSSPGENPWELAASSATVSDELDRVALTNPRMVYHGGKGGKIYLFAASAILDKKTNNVLAKGDVKIEYNDYTFSTNEINYSQETRRAETSSPVVIKGGDVRLYGKGLKLSVDTEEIEIQQDVQAHLFNVKKWVEPGRRLNM